MDSKIVIWIVILVMAIRVVTLRTKPKRCTCVRSSLKLTDECADPALNNCSKDATCTDLTTGFSCTCNSGFIGNGTFCVEQCGDGICEGENRSCFRNQSCLCTPGFHVLNETCVEECDTYGDTFIDYPGFNLSCPFDLDLTVITNMTECKLACVIFNCIGLTFAPDIPLCKLTMCDPLTDETTFEEASDNVTVSIRNCA